MLKCTRVFLLLLSITFISHRSIFSQDISWEQTKGPYGGFVQAIDQSPDGSIYTYTGFSLFRSSDMGATWNRTNLTTGTYAPAIICNLMGHIFVGDNNYVHKSTDQGETWVSTLETSKHISCFSLNPGGEIYFAAGNLIYHSTDDGNTWEFLSEEIPENIKGISVSGDSTYFAITNNKIFRSNDRGLTWTNVTGNLSGSGFNSLVVGKSGKVFAGYGNKIYSSTNNGTNWNISFQLTINLPFTNMVVDSQGIIYASIINAVLKSTNEGITWQQYKYVPLDNEHWINSGVCVSSEGVLLAGGVNGVLKFEDNLWECENSNEGLIGPNVHGYALGKKGKFFALGEFDIFSTEDGGNSWNSTNAKKIFNEFPGRAIAGDKKGNIFFGDDGGIVSSNDNGTTWKRWSSDLSIQDFAFGENNQCFALDQQAIYRSTNYGENWHRTKYWENNSPGRLISSKNNYLIVFRGSEILKSVDEGFSWEQVASNPDENITSAVITRKGFIIASVSNKIIKSEDDGKTWSSHIVDLYPWLIIETILETPNGCLYAKTNRGIFTSPDDGISWRLFDITIGSNVQIENLAINWDGYLYAGSQSKGAYRTSLPILKIIPPEVQDTPGDQKVYLSWNKNTSASFQKYRIYGSSRHYPTTLIDSTANGVNDTSIVISGLENLVPYYIVVSAVDDEGNESFSDEIEVTPIPVPSTPELVSVADQTINTPVNLQLQWNKSLHAESYHLQLAADTAFTVLIVNDSILTDTSKYISGLSNNMIYYWRVKASNIAGNTLWSQTWTFKTIVALPAIPELITPANESINNLKTIELSWNQAQNAETYRIQLSDDSSLSNLLVDDSTLIVSSKQISALKSGMKYYWRVKAKNIAGTSNYSPVWNFITLLESPEMFTAEAYGINKNKLVWEDKSDNESGFIIERSPAGSTFKTLDSVKANDTLYTDTTASSSETYKYRVKAYTEFTESGYSNEAEVTTLTMVDNVSDLPIEYSLMQNYPNPFNPATNIRYSLPEPGFVKLNVYNSLGEIVKSLVNEYKEAGTYEISFDASSLPSGIYVYRIESGKYTAIKKLVLLK